MILPKIQCEMREIVGALPDVDIVVQQKFSFTSIDVGHGVRIMASVDDNVHDFSFFPYASLERDAQCEYSVHVPAGVIYPGYIDLADFLPQNSDITIERLSLIIGEDAYIKIYDTRKNKSNQTTTIRLVSCTIKARGVLEYVQLMQQSSGAEMTAVLVTMSERARFEGKAIIESNYVGIWCKGILKERESVFDYVVTCVGQAQERAVIMTQQQHYAPHTHSRVLLRGSLHESARLYYRGNIVIGHSAVQAHADQQAHILLIGEHARARALPALEVLTHDVHCKHGSAIGYVDEQHIEYLCARGIERADAQRMVINGFLSAPVQGIDHEYKKRFSFFS